MTRLMFILVGFATLAYGQVSSGDELRVASDFEGASVRDVSIDRTARSVGFKPGGDPTRGWPCWWYFRIDGTTPGESLSLRLKASEAVPPNVKGTAAKPLAAAWAMPDRASYSHDGKTWLHSAKGRREGDVMIYEIKAEERSVHVAWGPPYTPKTAEAFIRELSLKSPHAKADMLCRSREGRAVPMLRIREGGRTEKERFGVWVQARQHAWESGSSWVAQGFAEWLTGNSPEAAWLRSHADTFIVPVMDADNAATGNGGKDALPQDHNRDWSDGPKWNEVAAAKRRVTNLIEQGRMDVFLDLHNPAPGDPTFFYVLPADLLKPETVAARDRFIELAYARISKTKPFIPMSSKPKPAGPAYHPLWRQISANWVAMNGNPITVSLCLETIWNGPSGTTEGYRAVGASLAASVQSYLAERPARDAR